MATLRHAAAVLFLAAAVAALLPGARAASGDRERLLAFKDTFSNGAQKLSDWVPDKDPCVAGYYSGVGCLAGDVIEM